MKKTNRKNCITHTNEEQKFALLFLASMCQISFIWLLFRKKKVLLSEVFFLFFFFFSSSGVHQFTRFNGPNDPKQFFNIFHSHNLKTFKNKKTKFFKRKRSLNWCSSFRFFCSAFLSELIWTTNFQYSLSPYSHSIRCRGMRGKKGQISENDECNNIIGCF